MLPHPGRETEAPGTQVLTEEPGPAVEPQRGHGSQSRLPPQGDEGSVKEPSNGTRHPSRVPGAGAGGCGGQGTPEGATAWEVGLAPSAPGSAHATKDSQVPGSLRGMQEDGHHRVQAGHDSSCQATHPKPQATLSLSEAWGCVQMAATGRVEHSLASTLRAGAQPPPRPPWLGSQPVLAGAGGTPGLQGQQ